MNNLVRAFLDDEDKKRLHAYMDTHMLSAHSITQLLGMHLLGKIGEIRRLIDEGDFAAVDEAIADYHSAIMTISSITTPLVVEDMAKEQQQKALALFHDTVTEFTQDEYWQEQQTPGPEEGAA